MTQEQERALIDTFNAEPYASYGRWMFEYVYPGFFAYHHQDIPRSVFFTPDHNREGELSLEVQDDEGGHVTSDSWPFTSYRAQDLFAMVRQWLDRVESEFLGPPSVLNWQPGIPQQ